MANEENLIPYGKGQSGNPNGRKKGSRNRATIVREALEMLIDEVGIDGEKTGKKIRAYDAITRAQLIKAIAGDPKSYELLTDGAFGKMTDKVQTTHTFATMGRVKVGEGAGEVKELSFDVGQELSEDGDSEEPEEEQAQAEELEQGEP